MATHMIFTVVFNVKGGEPITDLNAKPPLDNSIEKFKANLNTVLATNNPYLRKIDFVDTPNALFDMGEGYFIGIVTFDEDGLDDPTLAGAITSVLTNIFFGSKSPRIRAKDVPPPGNLRKQIRGMFHYRAWKLNSDGSEDDLDNIMATVGKLTPTSIDSVQYTWEKYVPNDGEGRHPRFANLVLDGKIVQPHIGNGSGGKD